MQTLLFSYGFPPKPLIFRLKISNASFFPINNTQWLDDSGDLQLITTSLRQTADTITIPVDYILETLTTCIVNNKSVSTHGSFVSGVSPVVPRKSPSLN